MVGCCHLRRTTERACDAEGRLAERNRDAIREGLLRTGPWRRSLYAIGGFGGELDAAVSSVEAYDPASDRWTSLSDMPHPRGYLSVARGGDDVGGRITRSAASSPRWLQALSSTCPFGVRR